MTARTLRVTLAAAGLAALVGAAGCAVSGGGYGYDGEVDYVGGFYEPYGYDYGGWGPGYRVGPPRGDWGRGHPAGPGPGGGHPYRSAPPGRSMPSIPGRPRGR